MRHVWRKLSGDIGVNMIIDGLLYYVDALFAQQLPAYRRWIDADFTGDAASVQGNRLKMPIISAECCQVASPDFSNFSFP